MSYTPPVTVEGAIKAPIVFDNGNDLVVAQVPIKIEKSSIEPTLKQLSANLHGAGRSSREVTIRLRALDSISDGLSRPIIIAEVIKDFNKSIWSSLSFKHGTMSKFSPPDFKKLSLPWIKISSKVSTQSEENPGQMR